MKKLIIIAMLAGCIFPARVFSQNVCDGSLWKYVYHPDRFIVWKKCATVTGILDSRKKEADGDYHIRIKLDKGQKGFLNQRNMDGQKGFFVLEVICANEVTQTDAVQPCKGCPKTITIPKKGTHVKVTGTFVKDTEANHGWNEIHPVYSIEEIP